MLQTAFHTNCSIFFYTGDNFAMFNVLEVSLLFAKHSGSFRFEQTETVFALLDEFRLL